jgi:DNA-binding beta-propeller fold protein YncE
VGSLDPVDGSSAPTTDGIVSVLDGASGRVVRTVRVGFTPTDIAIDALHRRALVVSSYSDVSNYNPMSWRPRESWWPQVLRRIKQVVCCLPFQAPAPPAPTTDGTVTTIDLSRL